MRIAFGLVLSVFASAATFAIEPVQRSLSFEERVKAQTAIERVYYSHQVGATKSFEAAVPRAVIEAKVRKYLEQSAALNLYWKTPVTDYSLQRELERMAQGTRMPERLQELYAALDNDAFLVKECVARATLVDRLTRNFYGFDPALHVAAHERAEDLRRRLLSGEISAWADHPNRRVRETIIGETAGQPLLGTGPSRETLAPDAFKTRRAQLPTRVGDVAAVEESREAFGFDVILSETTTELRVATFAVPKTAWDEWWGDARGEIDVDAVRPVAIGSSELPKARAREANCAATDVWDNGIFDALSARVLHTALWTGSQMLVWGGSGHAGGGRYDPATDTWSGISNSGAPAPGWAAAVWTGSAMLAWNSISGVGGRYDPIADSWMAMSTIGAPSPRIRESAVWAAGVLVVWGGYDAINPGQLDTGGRYDPQADSWAPTSTTGAPRGRAYASAVSTGNHMLLWGGSDGAAYFNDGGRYDPSTDQWQAISAIGAPSRRYEHSAVWTGSELIVWGGRDDGAYFGDGGRYDPAADRWTPVSSGNAPAARSIHSAVWNGNAMVVWGGFAPSEGFADTGGRYDPSTDTWTATATTGAPTGRYGHSAVWTGNLMIVWAGSEAQGLASGARYDPTNDSWTPVGGSAEPSPRFQHTAVWTGSLMVVWGGYDWRSYFGTGGRYDPALDDWRPTATAGAPSARGSHVAVWTGSRMVIWGGVANTYPVEGSMYDPAADNWIPTATLNAPYGRTGATAVWTGSRMIVWGGIGTSLPRTDTGALFDPTANSWTPTSTTGAPMGRERHTAVWTGSEMLVWGGLTPYGTTTEAGRYDPARNSWLPISSLNAPSPRTGHSAVWTGSLMVVWGGDDGTSYHLDTGGRYNPTTDSWLPTSLTGVPGGRQSAPAVWTGKRMLVWGGQMGFWDDGGGRYDPATDRWRLMSRTFEPEIRIGPTAVWTGSMMVVWGGIPFPGSSPIRGGGRYYLDAADDDEDGFSECRGDCDDSSASVYPGAPESCNGVDDDCDGIVDDGGDGLCHDANPCTDDVCLASSGCGFIDNIRACDDDNACTAADTCSGGSCHGSPSDGTACNDGDACTTEDACTGGACIGSGARDCDDSNRCNGIEACSPALGCVAGTPLSCDDGDLCDGAETCNPSTGCVAGTSLHCDDGNACNGVELCSPAIGCLDGSPINCDDGNQCTTDSCSPSAGCAHVVITQPCEDGSSCTTDDTCVEGICTGVPRSGACDDSNACTTGDYCEAGECYPGLDSLDCDDQNVCTDDSCDPGTGCIHDSAQVGNSCDDGNPCTLNACDPVLFCIFPPAPAGEGCDDFNPCTQNDRCDGAGSCAGQSACDDQIPCTDDFADPNASCSCSHEPSFPGTICRSSACMVGGTCDGNGALNSCIGETTLDCDDDNPCTDDSCDPATGCIHTNNTAACDDGSVCTEGDTCGGGLCLGTTVNCDDGNACTTDSCDPATGCRHANNANACNDGNGCTQIDLCVNGGCVGSNPVVCPAADQCHTGGTCDPVTGACSNTPAPDGTACNDNNVCTTGETCRAGTCTPATSGLNEANPRTNGYYKSLCHGPHSGDALTDADAVCVSTVAHTFAGISTVADLCAELQPSQPNSDACDRTDDDLMVLALNICRARVCSAQSIDSECGGNANVGQSLAESDAILGSPSRTATTCARAKCLLEEINTGTALELDTLTLTREKSGIRLRWNPPYLNDGTGHPSSYHVWRRALGSILPFRTIADTTETTFLDGSTGGETFQYEITAVMN